MSFHEHHLLEKDWCSIIEYPHLVSLDVEEADTYYFEHCSNATKTQLLRLTELIIHYDDLEMVTKNFTSDDMR